MNFFSHKIANPVGSGTTWDEYVEKYLNNLTKAAGREAKPECDDGDPRGSGRGQVLNTEGEKDMTNDPKPPKDDCCKGKKKEAKTSKVAECGKEMGESNDAGKVTEKHTPASPGDDKNKEPKVMINNDPNYQKGESVNPGKVNPKNKKGPNDAVVGKGKTASSQPKFKKVASMNRQEKVALIAQLGLNRKNPKAYIEAVAGVKIANLTSEEKEALVALWSTLEGEEYARLMVEDR